VAISISPRAKRFLQDKGVKTIVLSFVELETGCCVGVAKDVAVSFEPPRDPRKFWRRHADGWEVFVDRQLKSDAEVVIKKQGFWKFASLYVDGLRVPL